MLISMRNCLLFCKLKIFCLRMKLRCHSCSLDFDTPSGTELIQKKDLGLVMVGTGRCSDIFVLNKCLGMAWVQVHSSYSGFQTSLTTKRGESEPSEGLTAYGYSRMAFLLLVFISRFWKLKLDFYLLNFFDFFLPRYHEIYSYKLIIT